MGGIIRLAGGAQKITIDRNVGADMHKMDAPGSPCASPVPTSNPRTATCDYSNFETCLANTSKHSRLIDHSNFRMNALLSPL